MSSSIDERTPLLPPQTPPPLPPKLASPSSNLFPLPPSHPVQERPHIHLTPPINTNDRTLSLPALARAAAALQAGHLPSTEQLLKLCDLLLESSILDDDDDGNGTVWERNYGEGRLGTGRLTREGERVRLAAREGVWSVRELLEGRNPVIKRGTKKEGRVLVGETDEGIAGDGWQEFIHRTRETEVDIYLPSAAIPNPSSEDTAALRSSLLTLLQLFLTSPDLRTLLSDLVLLFRDTVDVVIETAEKKDHYINHGASEALQQLVTGVTEKAVGEEAVVEHDEKGGTSGFSYAAAAAAGAFEKEKGKEKVEVDVKVATAASKDPPEVGIQLNGTAYEGEDDKSEKDAPDPPEEVPQVPQKSPEQVKDAFIDRLKDILVHLQSTPSYQRSVQTLLSLLRSFLSRALIQAKPTATLHPVPLAPPEGEDSPLTPPETPPHPSIDEAVEEEGEDDEGAGDPTELLIPLLEPFTGGAGSLAPLRDALHSLLAHLQTPSPDLADDVDEELHRSTLPSHLHTLATLLDTLLSKSLLIPGWIGSSESYRSLSKIHDALLSLSSDAPALRTDLAHFLSLLLDALGSVANDPLLGRAVTAMEELGKALGGWASAAGETAVRAAGGEGVMAVWGDVVEWVVPRVLGVLKEVPLPRIEFASKSVDLAIDPPSLLSTSFIPSSLSLRTSTSLTYLPTSGSSSLALPPSASHAASPTLSLASAAARTAYAASTAVDVEGLRLEVNNVGYFARYHTGIPCVGDITEAGLLDLHFGEEAKGGGLALSLATTTSSFPSPSSATSTPRSLFTVDPTQTHAHLSHFSFTPHHSSHPWLVALFRPLLRKAVQKVVEREVRQVLLLQGAEWVGRKGWEVKEAKGRRDLDDEARGMRKVKGRKDAEGSSEVWKWAAAVWEVLTGSAPLGEPNEFEQGRDGEEDGKSVEEEIEDEVPSGLGYSLHLNRHGLAVEFDLERGDAEESERTTTTTEELGVVGLGTEGVVLPLGSAPIPSPGRPPKGLVRAAKGEVRREVEEGREAAREAMEFVGEVGEVRDEYGEWVESERGEERRGVRKGWRSEAFDLA